MYYIHPCAWRRWMHPLDTRWLDETNIADILAAYIDQYWEKNKEKCEDIVFIDGIKSIWQKKLYLFFPYHGFITYRNVLSKSVTMQYFYQFNDVFNDLSSQIEIVSIFSLIPRNFLLFSVSLTWNGPLLYHHPRRDQFWACPSSVILHSWHLSHQKEYSSIPEKTFKGKVLVNSPISRTDVLKRGMTRLGITDILVFRQENDRNSDLRRVSH